MTKTKTDGRSMPVDTVAAQAIDFRQLFDERSPLDQIVQEGVRRMLRETTNPIESTFATIRLRYRKTKGNGIGRASLAMIFKLAQSVSK